MTAPVRPVGLLIGGAAKCGTTSLKNYLGEHPQVCTHAERGINFFESDAEWEAGYAAAFRRYFPCADGSPGKSIVAKSIRVLYSPKAMARLREHNPEVQIVISLRDPVERAYSDYWYARRRGWEPASSFEAAIERGPEEFRGNPRFRERCDYLARSRYAEHLANLLDCFPRDQVHVVLLEDLRSAPLEVLRRLFRVLRIDESFVPSLERRANTAAMPRSRTLARAISASDRFRPLRFALDRVLSDSVKYRLRELLRRVNEKDFRTPPMDPGTRARLVEYFEPFNERAAELIGRPLDHWNRVASTEAHEATAHSPGPAGGGAG